jgi:hypothetical protein
MPPTDLKVPFHEKDDAKRLGAPRILLRSVSEAFEASAASIAYEPGFFERMRICPDPRGQHLEAW